MTKKILIDTLHPEESRVAVLTNDGSLESFEHETTSNRSLKGNIYLARTERIEPSLQAGFLDFGIGKDGFLAFNEIHPDYYRVPVEDQKALLEALSQTSKEASDDAPTTVSDAPEADDDAGALTFEAVDADTPVEDEISDRVSDTTSDDTQEASKASDDESTDTEDVRLKKNILKKYKIQEVVQKRQLMLVQVAKDPRGTKGAALTTYLSLPGRYCVLMPNTPKGGGISRKITDVKERKRLKDLVAELDIPQGMGVILRTAAVGRTKADIKKDYDYLFKTWEEIREKTVASSAPAMIYEEGNIITKTLRDLYTRDVDTVWVQGEDGYKEARALMSKLLPSHLKKVKLYQEAATPLFQAHSVEEKIAAVHTPLCNLPSGGYLVFGTTEALTAIDVNSGRSTRERDIHATALKTNLEAADEIARQLRLRDVGGLVVIDFIDMDHNRHNAQVERRLEKALGADRARIQVSRISAFGLLEMSRQRLKPSLQEAIGLQCPRCKGLGTVSSAASSALAVLRALETTLDKKEGKPFRVHVSKEVAVYLLNEKSAYLEQLMHDSKTAFRFYIDEQLIDAEHQIVMDSAATKGSTPSKAAQKTGAQKNATQKAPSKHNKKGKEPKGKADNKKLSQSPQEKPAKRAAPHLKLVKQADETLEASAAQSEKESAQKKVSPQEVTSDAKEQDKAEAKVTYKTTRNTRLKLQPNGRHFSNKKRMKPKLGLHNPKRAMATKEDAKEAATKDVKQEARPKTAPAPKPESLPDTLTFISTKDGKDKTTAAPEKADKAADQKAAKGGKKSWWKRILE